MRRKFLTVVLPSLLVACAAAALFLTYMQIHFRLYPNSQPIKPQPTDSPYQRITLSTEDGLTISAWYAPPTKKTGQAVLLLHGLAGNRDQLLPYAAYLLEAGYGALLVDFRNHGESDGDVTSMGYHEIKDARAAYTYLTAQPGIEAVAIWGHSMGAGVAIKLMSEVDAAGLIVDAAFTDYPSQIHSGRISGAYPSALAEFFFIQLYGALSHADLTAIRPIDALEQVNRPVLIMHGSDDNAISLTHAKQLAAVNPLARLSIFEGGGHGSLLELEPDRYREEALAYLSDAFAALEGE